MRKFPIAAAGSVLLAMGVAACGGSSADTASTVTLNSTTTAVNAVCEGTPQPGGSLVYARQSETQVLNPLEVRNGNGDIFADELLFNGLLRSDPRGSYELQPAIADRWSISRDGKVYTFHLRPGIKFSNGQPVRAEDVKFSLDRFGDPRQNAVLGAVAAGYKGTEVVDDETVKITLANPVAAWLYNISIFPAFIVPKDLVERQGDAFWKRPVGTGPYMVKEFARGSHITFERNPHYWESGKPYLDEIRFNFITDGNSRVLALKNGQAQIADGIPFSQVNAIDADRNLVIQAARVPLFLGMWFNHQRPPLADRDVRQAMQYAIDKESINRAIFRGVGTIPNSVLPPFKFDASDEDLPPYAFDLEQARRLMASSRFPDGFEISLQYPAGFEYYKQLGLLLQQQWAPLGIRLKLVEQDQATVSQRFYQSDYDLTFPYAQFTSDVVVPDEYALFVADPSNGLRGFYSNWENPEVVSLVKQFTQSTDEAQRTELWPRIQRLMLEDSPWINVMNLPFINAHETNVCGTSVNALGADHLEDTWLAK
jgi:peptide/nickel transport system substrate-binding protein